MYIKYIKNNLLLSNVNGKLKEHNNEDSKIECMQDSNYGVNQYKKPQI